ncbi:MAG: transglycosylase domain-containing protein [Actinomycetota bacterium]
MSRRRASILVLTGLLVTSSCSLEPIDLASERALALRTTISASDGTFLARLYRARGNRALVRLKRVPRHTRDAVLAAEDARFFRHPGYDIRSIARAALINLDKGEIVQGGSTITQQYVKNTFFKNPGERTFERKARELRLAIELERRYSKREILEKYLNTVYLGQGAYGLKTAAEGYFHKRVPELTLRESALLAAVIKAPSYYDPRDYQERARDRRNYVLRRMNELGMITPAVARRASRRALGVTPNPPQLSVRQPYFVEAVKREVLNDPRLGENGGQRAAALYKGGLRITTTLVPHMQRAAEDAAARILGEPGDPEVALVAIDPKSGHVVAMLGGRNWDVSQVNLALGREGGGSGRQPGSSFKPIALAAALEAGIPIETRYEASPASFPLADGSTWTVHNSEGTTSGQLPLDEALVRSVNGVYARLALQIGADRIASQAELMGVRTELPRVPSIALGSTEVSVLDMAAAYATLANGGSAIEPTTIEKIELPGGSALTQEREELPSVVSPGNVFLLTEALQDVIERGTGRAAAIGRPAAGKTGTTDDYADAWFVGYTPDLVAAVWVGYPKGRIPMTNVHGITVFGGTYPAAIWREFMLAALRDVPFHPFRFPEDELVTVEIDPATGLLAAPWCPGVKRTMLLRFVPTQTCPLPSAGDGSAPVTEDRRGDDKKTPAPTTSPGPNESPSPSETGSPEPKPTKT